MSPHKAFSGSRTSQIICIVYLLCIILFSQRIYLTNSLLKRGSFSCTGVAQAMTAVIFFFFFLLFPASHLGNLFFVSIYTKIFKVF